jgi:Arc/MetJ family transcription regulator
MTFMATGGLDGDRKWRHNSLCETPCGGFTMATNLQLDDRLILKAVKLGGHRTKKAAVTQALTEYIQNLEQRRITELFGKVDYDPAHDYKKQRSRL